MSAGCVLAVLALGLGGFLAIAGLQLQLGDLDQRLGEVEAELASYD